jgi:hypothetical protein
MLANSHNGFKLTVCVIRVIYPKSYLNEYRTKKECVRTHKMNLFPKTPLIRSHVVQ